MLLSDQDLLRHIHRGRLVVDPWDVTMVQPASIDLRLSHEFRIFPPPYPFAFLDPLAIPDDWGQIVEPELGSPFMLRPGDFVLGSTLERVKLPADLAARLEGKSTLGRLGLNVHATAGFIDPGFDGQITLEMSNVSNIPIALWPSMKIGQLCVVALLSQAARPYGSPGLGSRYQGQQGPQAAKQDPFPHPLGSP